MAKANAEQSAAAGRDDGKCHPPRRRGSSRPAGESGDAVPRPAEGTRRRRSPERRPGGWGDGIDRFACARDVHRLPPTFPVEARTGAAAILATVVARRPDALLLCTFTHGGPHRWPDGEEAEPSSAAAVADGS